MFSDINAVADDSNQGVGNEIQKIKSKKKKP